MSDSFNSVVVPSPLGKPQYAYLARNENSQISILDNATECPGWCIYHAHTFTGNEQHRSLRKKLIRIHLFGEGTIATTANAGVMTVTADNNRQDVYIYSVLAGSAWEGILWLQNTLALTGRTFDVQIALQGTGLAIREIALEYTPVG